MARFVKHIGKHNNRKVVIVYKKIPEENHMCLVVYPDSLPALLHDEAMKVLESPVGQDAKELADALFRHIMPDGNNALIALHKGNVMKKVPTNQVTVAPNASSTIRLDELNDMLEQMEQGEAAVKKMAEIDASRGMAGGNKGQGRELGQPEALPAGINAVLTDEVLASQRAQQAARFRADAASMLAEADRLDQEAASLLPAPPKPKLTRNRSKPTVENATKSTNVRKPRTKKVPA